jgi:hypothetical protein
MYVETGESHIFLSHLNKNARYYRTLSSCVQRYAKGIADGRCCRIRDAARCTDFAGRTGTRSQLMKGRRIGDIAKKKGTNKSAKGRFEDTNQQKKRTKKVFV